MTLRENIHFQQFGLFLTFWGFLLLFSWCYLFLFYFSLSALLLLLKLILSSFLSLLFIIKFY